MKPTPASLSQVALPGAVPLLEKRLSSLSGASESVSSFEALLRATPGSSRPALVAAGQAADKTQLSMTESAAVLDLLGMASQSSASFRSSPEETIEDESGRGLVLPEAVAPLALPFWPVHLGAAWGGDHQALANSAGTSDSLGQAVLAQSSLAVTALGADGSLPDQSNVAGSRVASVAAGQTAVPAGFVPMDPANVTLPVFSALPDLSSLPALSALAAFSALPPGSALTLTEISAALVPMYPALETLPLLPALPALPPGSPPALTDLDRTPARASVEVSAKTVISDKASMPIMPISRAATSSFDLMQPQVVATPFAVAMASTAAPKPVLRALPVVSGAPGPRLSVEPRPLDSAGVVLAQFGAVSVVAKPTELEQNLSPSALIEVQPIADTRGAWVPELGGMVAPVETSTAPIDFAQHLAEYVDTWVSQNFQVAELRLQEPSSNPVLVRIEMNGQQASVMFRTDVPACREALTTQMDQLSDLLSAQGLQLTGASVAGSGADSQPGREARPGPLWGEPAARRLAPETSGVVQSPPRRGPASAGRTLDVFV